MPQKQIHIIISGPQGTGKTQLAEHIALMLKRQCVHGITIDGDVVGAVAAPMAGNAFRRCDIDIETVNFADGGE